MDGFPIEIDRACFWILEPMRDRLTRGTVRTGWASARGAVAGATREEDEGEGDETAAPPPGCQATLSVTPFLLLCLSYLFYVIFVVFVFPLRHTPWGKARHAGGNPRLVGHLIPGMHLVFFSTWRRAALRCARLRRTVRVAPRRVTRSVLRAVWHVRHAMCYV